MRLRDVWHLDDHQKGRTTLWENPPFLEEPLPFALPPFPRSLPPPRRTRSKLAPPPRPPGPAGAPPAPAPAPLCFRAGPPAPLRCCGCFPRRGAGRLRRSPRRVAVLLPPLREQRGAPAPPLLPGRAGGEGAEQGTRALCEPAWTRHGGAAAGLLPASRSAPGIARSRGAPRSGVRDAFVRGRGRSSGSRRGRGCAGGAGQAPRSAAALPARAAGRDALLGGPSSCERGGQA